MNRYEELEILPKENPAILDQEYHILLIEDDIDLASMVIEYFELHEKFIVEAAHTVGELWKSLTVSEYDLLILDYQLPDDNGLDALLELRKRGYTLPVIMITGLGDERVAVQAIRNGAFNYLVKERNFLELLPSMIEQAIQDHQIKEKINQIQEQIWYQALLLSNVQDAIVVWDADGKIMYWNHAAENLFGKKEEDQIGKRVESNYFGLFLPRVTIPRLGKTESIQREKRFKRGDETIWVNSYISVLRDNKNDSREIGFIDVSRNITVQKDMEAQVKAAQAHFLRSAPLSAIGALASDVAHQISNPLTTVIAETQLLAKDLSDEDSIHGVVDTIQKAGWQAQGFVRQLTEFSELISSFREPISISQTIKDALVFVQAVAESQGFEIETNLVEEKGLVRGNAQQLIYLWMNLMLLLIEDNNISKGLSFQVRSRYKSDNWYEIMITEPEGKLDPEKFGVIIDPSIVNAGNNKDLKVELVICNEIVRLHKGLISVDCVLGKGTKIIVSFPMEDLDG